MQRLSPELTAFLGYTSKQFTPKRKDRLGIRRVPGTQETEVYFPTPFRVGHLRWLPKSCDFLVTPACLHKSRITTVLPYPSGTAPWLDSPKNWTAATVQDILAARATDTFQVVQPQQLQNLDSNGRPSPCREGVNSPSLLFLQETSMVAPTPVPAYTQGVTFACEGSIDCMTSHLVLTLRKWWQAR